MVRNLILIVLFLLSFIVYIRFIEWHTIFYPLRQIEETPASVGLDYEDIFFKTADGVLLNGWWVGRPGAGCTLLFFHGNGGNIGNRLDKIVLFNKLGLNVFIIDYRGYGKSKGISMEQGLYRDGLAAYDYLAGRQDAGQKRIAYGESLGSAVAINLCGRRSLGGIIVDSAFTRAEDMRKIVFPLLPSFLMASKFDSLEKIKRLTIPKLFIHSPEDEIVPFWQGEELFAAAPEPKEFLKIIGGHNSGFYESRDKIQQKIAGFLKRYNLY